MPAAVSFAPFYLIGLGALLLHPLAGEVSARLPRGDARRTAALLAWLLAVGLLANLCLVLIAGSLLVAGSLGVAISVAGWVFAVPGLARRPAIRPAQPTATAPKNWWGLVLFAIVGLNATLIVAVPLTHWDARSVWFFQAKVIHFAGALSSESPWALFDFAHADYPKLLPVVAAQVATVAGSWNELLPKTALLLLLLPAALGYFGALRQPLSWCFLIAMTFLPTWPLLWDGYADGYLALFAGLGVLKLGRAAAGGGRVDALIAAAWLALAASLKNEGLLLLLCAGTAVAIGCAASASLRSSLAALSSPASRVANARSPRFAWLPILVVTFAAPLLWLAIRAWWGLESDLSFGASALGAAVNRIAEGAPLAQIAAALFYEGALLGACVPLALAAIAARVLGLRFGAAASIPVATALFYLAGLAFVYLTTPHDLAWHLDTSAERTALPVFAMLSVAAFFALEAIEAPDASQPERARTRPRAAGTEVAT